MINIYSEIKETKIPIIMGILNVTPDSFSDGGDYYTKEKAVNHAIKLLEEGADIIDVGGESTRPGSKAIDANEELERVIPVIEELLYRKPDTIISIDTSKSEVAERAVKIGVSIINDVSGGIFDEKIFYISSKYNVPIVLMHMKGKPENMQLSPSYDNVINEISYYFEDRIKTALSYNVEKIILDPGIGFGKRVEDNYLIIRNLDKFKKLNYPILIGISRKSFLGKSLNLEIKNRDNSTIIAETLSAIKGAKVIRTHNVKNAVELKNMLTYLTKE